MIEFKQVTIRRGGHDVFTHFNWQIKAGEHWVMSGANGSGKTTLLEVLTGRHQIPQGHITYDFVQGQTWEARYEERQRHIGYIPVQAVDAFVPADHTLYYQQRYYAGAEEGLPTVRTVLGDGLASMASLGLSTCFDITPLLDVEVSRLSNGQLKKLTILKRLLKQMPRLLLLDYPFEGLDYQSREDLCAFLDSIATTQGVQIILVDHHHHLPTVMNKRLVLAAGKVLRIEDVTITEPAIKAIDRSEEQTTSSADADVVVEMRDLTIRYGTHTIIDRLQWKIHRGERWALTGPNGSGKTTLFSLIYADHPMAYSQQVYLFGRRRGTGESIWDIKNRVNYFGPEQINYLHTGAMHRSGRAYITTLQKELNEAVFEELITYFQAAAFIDRPVRSLSAGQLQLLLLMQCFLTEKELLLLDEPFQFLDPATKARVQAYLQAHMPADRTLVLITHYEEDIARWTQQVKDMRKP